MVVLSMHWYLQNFVSAMINLHTRTMYALSMTHCMLVALFPYNVKLALLGSPIWMMSPVICYILMAFTQLILWFRVQELITDKFINRLLALSIVLMVLAYIVFLISKFA